MSYENLQFPEDGFSPQELGPSESLLALQHEYQIRQPDVSRLRETASGLKLAGMLSSLRTSYLPWPTPQQEQLLFGLLRDDGSQDSESKVLLRNESFLQTLQAMDVAKQEVWHDVVSVCPTVRDIIIIAYQRLVYAVVQRHMTMLLPLRDRIAGGNVGLNQAVSDFDVKRGNSFITLATKWIMRGVRQEAKAQGISYKLQRGVTGLQKMAMYYEAAFGESATEDEMRIQLLANADGREGRPLVTVDQVDHILEYYALRDHPRRWAAVRGHSIPTVHGEIFFEQDQIAENSVSEQYEKQEVVATMQRALTMLESQQQALVRLVFGLDDDPVEPHIAAERLGLQADATQALLADTFKQLRSIPDVRALASAYAVDNVESDEWQMVDVASEQANDIVSEVRVPDSNVQAELAKLPTVRARLVWLVQRGYSTNEIMSHLGAQEDKKRRSVNTQLEQLVKMGRIKETPAKREREERLKPLLKVLQLKTAGMSYADMAITLDRPPQELIRDFDKLRQRGMRQTDKQVRQAATTEHTLELQNWIREHPRRLSPAGLRKIGRITIEGASNDGSVD
jgi:RNA polymerase sigma factor (sigma-70 family)